MSKISQLSPVSLWQWFDKICAIPHPSYHEEQLAQMIVDWAHSQQFFVERDEAGNILIRKPATQGMENRKSIALQAHLDMVPQANADTVHDFTCDPILPYIDGDWVKAEGTTLGADNGIGLASCLAVLSSSNLAHPDIEVLLTMSEEVGMEGAIGLRPNWLQSQIMINTDTEDNGEIYIGCAGGENINIELPLNYIANNDANNAYRFSVKGLHGGHSGCDIHTNRVNAIKLLARVLAQTSEQQVFQLAEISAGSVRNAIPRESNAIIVAKDPQNLTAYLNTLTEQLKAELKLAEPNLSFVIEAVENPAKVLDSTSTKQCLHFLNVLPNGVLRYSDELKDVVETSLSIGVLEIEDDMLVSTILARSLIESGKEEIRSKIASLAQLVGAKAEFSGNYPGWQPSTSSEITQLTKRIYDQILGYEAKIKVIHAGLECGLIKKAYPELDIVSIGPTIRNAHSPDEKVHIPAVQIYWSLLTQLLAAAPNK